MHRRTFLRSCSGLVIIAFLATMCGVLDGIVAVAEQDETG